MTQPIETRFARRERGTSLIVVLIMLSVIFVIGAVSSQYAIFGERSARNDRDRQVAYQAAEAALIDAEIEIIGPNSAVNKRNCRLHVDSLTLEFAGISGCGTGNNTGFCVVTTSTGALEGEAWKTVKSELASETGTTSTNKTVEYGQFTGRALPAGLLGTGGMPAKAPRYVMEAVRYTPASLTEGGGAYGLTAFVVTAMGFGFRSETRVVLQALYYNHRDTTKPC